MTRTTAISSYIIDDKKVDITGITRDGASLSIPADVYKLFGHENEQKFHFNMKRLIDHIIVKNEYITSFKNICFIDTPVFNPGSDTDTDKQTALEALANVNAFIWCVPCTAGTIRKDEFDILNEIFETKPDCKFYVILNKADQKPVDEAEDVLEDIYDNIVSNGLDKYLEGMCLYSANKKFDSQDSDYSAHKGKTLLEFFKQYDIPNKKEKNAILQEISAVFEGYIDNDKELIKDYQTILDKVNVSEYSFDMSINMYKTKLGQAEAKAIRSGGKFDDLEPSTVEDYSKEFHEVIGDIEFKFKKLIDASNSNIETAKDLKQKISLVFKDFWLSINKWDSYLEDQSSASNKLSPKVHNNENLNIISMSDFSKQSEFIQTEIKKYTDTKYIYSNDTENLPDNYLKVNLDDPSKVQEVENKIKELTSKLQSISNKLILPDALLKYDLGTDILDKEMLKEAVKSEYQVELT